MIEKVQCPICGGLYKRLAGQHLKTHGLTVAKFEELYPDSSTVSEASSEAARLKTIEQYSTQEARDNQSERITEYNKNHPEAHKAKAEAQRGVPRPSETCAVISAGMKNSDAVKARSDRQRGGNDIINHHYIYDESDLSKNIVQMTRSDHMKLHRLLQKLGYIIPHINIKEEL